MHARNEYRAALEALDIPVGLLSVPADTALVLGCGTTVLYRSVRAPRHTYRGLELLGVVRRDEGAAPQELLDELLIRLELSRH